MRFQPNIIHQHLLRKFANLLICQFAKWQTGNLLGLEGFKLGFPLHNTKLRASQTPSQIHS